MLMPHSLQYILDHADELADRFEKDDFDSAERKDARPLAALRDAVVAAGHAQENVAAAVVECRDAGLSWATIGAYLGTSGEAARQRYSGYVRAEYEADADADAEDTREHLMAGKRRVTFDRG